MHSIDFSVKLTFVVFSGIAFYVACHDSHEQCFDVESKTICYFFPNVSSVDWDTAWKTCKELNANLPVILGEKGHKVLGDYLGEHFPSQSVWTAGRYVGSSSEWRWLNNQIIRRTEEPKCPQRKNYNDCPHETQAVLTKQLEYEARYPNNVYNYICILPAVNCTTESPTSISWKSGCLTWTTNHRLQVNKARNECLKGGGDLATFSEDEDLQHLQRLSSVMQDADIHGYLIGLHWKWWIWNSTDVHDIKFNLLNDYEDPRKDCLFIDDRSKWSRDTCSVNKRCICQTEKRNRSSADAPFTETVTVLTVSPVETTTALRASTKESDIRTVTVLTASPLETPTASRASTDDSGIFTSRLSKRGKKENSTSASVILHVTSTWSNRKNLSTLTIESAILHDTSTWSQRENQTTSTNESVILHDFSTEHLIAIIIGVTVGLVIFIVALIFSCRKLCKKKATGEKDRQSGGNQSQVAECKGTDEICGFYAEVTRKVHDEEQGDNTNEPQTSIVYATLEFEKSKVAKEEPTTSNPHEPDVVSDPAEAVPADAIG